MNTCSNSKVTCTVSQYIDKLHTDTKNSSMRSRKDSLFPLLLMMTPWWPVESEKGLEVQSCDIEEFSKAA